MMPRLQCPPGAEITGDALRAFVYNLKIDNIQPLLQKYNLIDVQTGLWYPVSPLINLMDEMAPWPSFDETMLAVGMRVAEFAVNPEDVVYPTLDSWLLGWNEHMQANHRNGNIGEIVTEKIAERHYRTIHRHISRMRSITGWPMHFRCACCRMEHTSKCVTRTPSKGWITAGRMRPLFSSPGSKQKRASREETPLIDCQYR